MSTATTHIDNKPSLRGTKQSHPLAPELRFKEFIGEWNENKLNDIAEFKKGKGISKADITEDGELECIRYGELYTTYTELIQDIVSKTNLHVKDLILSEFNDVIIPASGESNIDIATASCVLKSGVAFSGDLNIIRSKMNGIFLSFYLNNKRKFDIARLAQGVSVVHLYSSQLKTLKLNFPSLPEQQKIASFLSAVDKKIQQLTKKKALLDRYKKGVMQQLFSSTGSGHRSGQLRFKDDTSSSLGAGNGNAYPDWEEKRLGEIATKLSSNISANTIEENIGEYKIYGASGFLKKIDFFREEKPFISIVKDGAGVGRTLLCDANSSVLGTLDIIKPKSKVVLYFLYSVLNNIRFEKYMVGSTIPHIYYKDYSSERITIPCIEEQQKIAAYLSSIDTKIEAVKSQITQTQIFKKGLLQQLFV
jgi:type I restriction enzyme S subunit